MKKTIACLVLLLLLTTSQTVLAADLGTWPGEAIQWHPSGLQGQGIRIAVIDTGISEHAIDPTHLAAGYNYLDQNHDTSDLVGHGTALAGIILGIPAKQVPGIAPNATLVPLVCYSLGYDGQAVNGGSELVAQAIQDAVKTHDCQVILIGAGIIGESDALKSAVEFAEKQGVVVVSSVGNENEDHPESVYYPAAYATVLGVAALREDNGIATFSQRNESVKLSAPGSDVKVATIRGRIIRAFGTSYAAAYVAGGAALLRAECPTLDPSQIRSALTSTARDIKQPGFDQESGYGVMQIGSALEKAQSMDASNRAATARERLLRRSILAGISLLVLLAIGAVSLRRFKITSQKPQRKS